MTKKDYQAIARALYLVRPICDHGQPWPTASDERPGCVTPIAKEQWNFDMQAIAQVLANDSPRFDRARFVEACETGKCKGMAK